LNLPCSRFNTYDMEEVPDMLNDVCAPESENSTFLWGDLGLQVLLVGKLFYFQKNCFFLQLFCLGVGG